MDNYNTELSKYLSQFLSDNRKQQFEKTLQLRTKHFAIALEDMYQQHNANAVIRSAECFGIQDVYTVETINAFNPSKGVSKGSIKWIDRYSYTEFDAIFKDVKEKAYQVVATSPHAGDISLDDFDVTKKSIFFFGAEKKGISDTTIKNADVFLKIPMQGFTESLNVSVSAAIIMQKLTDKLRKSKDVSWQLSQEEKDIIFLDWTKKSVSRIDKILEEFDKNWQKNKQKH